MGVVLNNGKIVTADGRLVVRGNAEGDSSLSDDDLSSAVAPATSKHMSPKRAVADASAADGPDQHPRSPELAGMSDLNSRGAQTDSSGTPNSAERQGRKRSGAQSPTSKQGSPANGDQQSKRAKLKLKSPGPRIQPGKQAVQPKDSLATNGSEPALNRTAAKGGAPGGRSPGKAVKLPRSAGNRSAPAGSKGGAAGGREGGEVDAEAEEEERRKAAVELEHVGGAESLQGKKDLLVTGSLLTWW